GVLEATKAHLRMSGELLEGSVGRAVVEDEVLVGERVIVPEVEGEHLSLVPAERVDVDDHRSSRPLTTGEATTLVSTSTRPRLPPERPRPAPGGMMRAWKWSSRCGSCPARRAGSATADAGTSTSVCRGGRRQSGSSLATRPRPRGRWPSTSSTPTKA